MFHESGPGPWSMSLSHVHDSMVHGAMIHDCNYGAQLTGFID